MSQRLSLARFDANLAYIWNDLMNDRGRTLARHTLVRVLIGSGLVILTPYAIGFLVDGLTSGEMAALITGAVLFVTIKLSNTIVGWWRQQIRERFFQEEFWYLPQTITRRYVSRPLAWLAGGAGEIDGNGVESLRDKVWNVIHSYLFSIIPGYGQIAFAIIMTTIAHPALGLLALLFVLNEVRISRRENTWIQGRMKPVIDQFKKWERRLGEKWHAIDHVKSHGGENKFLQQIREEVQPALREDDFVWRVKFAQFLLQRRLRDLFFGSLLFGGLVYLVETNQVSLAIAILVFFSFERISGILGELNDQQREVLFNIAGVDKYRCVLSQPAPFSYDQGTLLTDPTVAVLFDSVSHTVGEASDQALILRDVSFTINAGEKVGIVGPSGAGKSQLLGLILRSIDPMAGRVLINTIDLRTLSRESFLRTVSVIMQKSEPYEDTLIGNLLAPVSHLVLPQAFKDLAADRQVVIAKQATIALEKAGLMLDRFDDGLHTRIGYKGLKLSGGQQQRLQIAAAHLKLSLNHDCAGLILADEPTASLDSLSELTVMQHLQTELAADTTMLMVAHRLSTVANMDKIVFVRPLAACDSNTPQVTVHDSLQELYATEALFREMADAQGFRP